MPGVAGEALSLSQSIGSARVVERLREFDDAVAPFATMTVAHDFREQFRLTTPAA